MPSVEAHVQQAHRSAQVRSGLERNEETSSNSQTLYCPTNTHKL